MNDTTVQKDNGDKFERIYSQALLWSGEPIDVCDEIVRWVSDLLNVEFSFIERIENNNLIVVSSAENGKIVHSGELPIKGTPCAEVQLKKKPCCFENVADQFPDDPYLKKHNIRYYCGVPIFDHDGAVIGVLNALGTEIREVSPEDLKLLELMAKRASLELEQIRLENEAHRLQQNLLDIGQEILQQQDVGEILRRVADGIQTHSPFRLVAISLYQQPIGIDGDTEERIGRIVLGGLSEEDECKLMEMAESGHFISARDIIAKGRKLGGGYYVSPELIPELIPASIKGSDPVSDSHSWGPYDDLYIFLEQGDRIIGRISLADPVSGALPSEKELESLNLFANLASLALDKAKRLDELERYQQRLEGIYAWNDQLVKCSDLKEMSKIAVEVMIEMFDYDLVSLFRKVGSELDLIGFETKLQIDQKARSRFQLIEIGHGVVGATAESRVPVLVPNVERAQGYISGHDEIKSEMAVPIMDGDDLFGVLNIESRVQNAFGQEDLKLLDAFASQLALIIRGIRRREDVEWINRFLQGLQRTSDMQETLVLIIERGVEILSPKANAGSFLVWNEKSQAFEFAAAVNRDLEQLNKVILSKELLMESIFTENRPVMLTRSAQRSDKRLNQMLTPLGENLPASTISLPIRDEEELVAVLSINNLTEEGIFDESDADKLWDLISEIELALARARDHEKLKKMATHDALTNTFNRHFFSEYVDDERYPELLQDAPISLVMVDIDDFYQVNDRYGHAEGDHVLQQVADLIRNEVRKLDMVVRYGGDEFIIIMPETNEEQALSVMERLRAKFEAWKPDLPDLNLSISFGVASWDPSADVTLLEVVEKADQFMYHRRQERVHDRRARKQAIIGSGDRAVDPDR